MRDRLKHSLKEFYLRDLKQVIFIKTFDFFKFIQRPVVPNLKRCLKFYLCMIYLEKLQKSYKISIKPDKIQFRLVKRKILKLFSIKYGILNEMKIKEWTISKEK